MTFIYPLMPDLFILPSHSSLWHPIFFASQVFDSIFNFDYICGAYAFWLMLMFFWVLGSWLSPMFVQTLCYNLLSSWFFKCLSRCYSVAIISNCLLYIICVLAELSLSVQWLLFFCLMSKGGRSSACEHIKYGVFNMLLCFLFDTSKFLFDARRWLFVIIKNWEFVNSLFWNILKYGKVLWYR